MRTAFILILSLMVLQGHAQLGDKVRHMLVGDSTAPPDYDTAYVASYHSNITISVLTKYQSVDVDIEPDKGDDLSFSTNNNAQYGVGINFKWLSAEVTFNVPALDDYDPSLGKTDSHGFGLGYTGRRIWARGFWSGTQGYYLNDPKRWTAGWEEGDDPVVRSDISSDTYLLSLNYALSGKRRFSQNAALFQMERQKKSAGTFVAGLSAWYTTVSGDSSLLSPALVDTFQLASGFTGVNRILVGATLGYVHTFSFWKKGFINLSVLPGFTYARQTIDAPSGEVSGTGLAGVTETKAGIGFNGDRWYSALTTAYYYSTAAIADNLNLATNYGFVRFSIGIRLGDPGIKVLGKVGL